MNKQDMIEGTAVTESASGSGSSSDGTSQDSSAAIDGQEGADEE